MINLSNGQNVPLKALFATLDGVENIGIIGIENIKTNVQTLAWSMVKSDMKHFRKTTEYGVVIMGNNTLKSMGNKPLKNRINLVLTNDETLIESTNNVITKNIEITSLKYINESMLDGVLCEIYETDMFIENIECFVIGGTQIYNLFKDKVDRFYVSFIDPIMKNPLAENEQYVTMDWMYNYIAENFTLTNTIDTIDEYTKSYYFTSYFIRK